VPRTDVVLADPRLAAAREQLGGTLVKAAVFRAQELARTGAISPASVADTAAASLPRTAATLTPVINATGVLVHTRTSATACSVTGAQRFGLRLAQDNAGSRAIRLGRTAPRPKRLQRPCFAARQTCITVERSTPRVGALRCMACPVSTDTNVLYFSMSVSGRRVLSEVKIRSGMTTQTQNNGCHSRSRPNVRYAQRPPGRV